jgi:hypothetical protein
MNRIRTITILTGVLLSLAVLARAQEVGTVAAADGSGEIGRDGGWTPAAIGAAVYSGDHLRTARPGRLRVVFQDDSVLTVSDDSEVTIDRNVFDPKQGKVESSFDLLKGKVSSLVSEYYHNTGAIYQVKSPTAVAGVRGTEFTIAYNADSDSTEVVGISGHVEVRGLADPSAPGVLITAEETTMVRRGELPTSPRRLDDAFMRQQLHDISFVGGGRAESLGSDHPLRVGASVPATDRAGVAAGPPPVVDLSTQTFSRRDASDLIGKPGLSGLRGQLGISF